MSKLKYGLAVVGLCILGSVLYGIAHDLVTAHVCVEYFTKWHPKVINSESPISMAFLWGFIATWWMGAIFGAALAGCATYGNQPLLPLRRIWRAIAIGLISVFLMAMLTLACVYVIVLTMQVNSPNTPAELLAVGATHQLSYFASAVLGIVLCVWVVRTRIAIDPALPAWVDP